MRRMMLLLLAGGLACAPAAGNPVGKGAYYGARPTTYPAWFKESFLDLREDIAEASKSGKRVLLFFAQDNCPYCNLLVERNLAQRDIEAALRARFDVILLNLWGDREVTGTDGRTLTEKAFAAALRVQFTPTLLFFDERGEVVLRLNGYVPPARFQAVLDWVSDRGETRQPFRDYLAGLERAGQGTGELIVEDYFLKTTDLRRSPERLRPLAVFFEQKDCPDCVKLHRRVLADPEVREALSRLDTVQLDLWSNTEIVRPDGRKSSVRDWARELDLKYAPGIVLFDENGNEVIRWEADFRVFHTAGLFEYVGGGGHRQEPSFQRFLAARAEHLRAAGRDVNIWRYADEPLVPPK